jgi:hypothetical protein
MSNRISYTSTAASVSNSIIISFSLTIVNTRSKHDQVQMVYHLIGIPNGIPFDQVQMVYHLHLIVHIVY